MGNRDVLVGRVGIQGPLQVGLLGRELAQLLSRAGRGVVAAEEGAVHEAMQTGHADEDGLRVIRGADVPFGFLAFERLLKAFAVLHTAIADLCDRVLCYLVKERKKLSWLPIAMIWRSRMYENNLKRTDGVVPQLGTSLILVVKIKLMHTEIDR